MDIADRKRTPIAEDLLCCYVACPGMSAPSRDTRILLNVVRRGVSVTTGHNKVAADLFLDK